MANQRKVTEM